MSVNLMDLVQAHLGNDAIGKIAGLLGKNEATTKSAVGATLPTVLASLINKAGTDTGSAALAKDLDNFDDGLLDKLGDSLTSGGHGALVNSGNGILNGLFGSGLGSVVDVLGRVGGLGSGNSRTLLSTLAPIVMGALARHKRGAGLNPAGLASLLLGQRDSIARLLPSGIGEFVGFAAPSNRQAPANTHTTQSTASTGNIHSEAERPRRGGLGRLIPLALLALAGLWFFQNVVNKKADEPSTVVVEESAPVQAAPAEAVTVETPPVREAAADYETTTASTTLSTAPESFVGSLQSVFGNTTEALTGIDSLGTAREALPRLTESAAQMGQLGAVVNTLPEGIRSQVGPLVENFLPQFQEAAERVRAIPGVGSLVDPVLNKLSDSVQAFGQ